MTYCLKCKKSTENVNLKALKTKNGKTMLSSKCAVCSIKKSRLMKEQEAKGILSSLGLKTPLSNIPLLGAFCFKFMECNFFNVAVIYYSLSV